MVGMLMAPLQLKMQKSGCGGQAGWKRSPSFRDPGSERHPR